MASFPTNFRSKYWIDDDYFHLCRPFDLTMQENMVNGSISHNWYWNLHGLVNLVPKKGEFPDPS